MAGRSSRQKGKRGEREAASALRALGIAASRTAQHRGSPDSPDLSIPGSSLRIEVKRGESLRLWQALEQARENAGDGIPLVMHRANRRPWIVILEVEQIARFAREVIRVLANGVDREG